MEREDKPPFADGAVPVPNALFDVVLPTLKDTELRVLLVVLRQTLGWRESRCLFKERDWLTHAQLVRRTGRGSEAVSSAVAALVERGLIVVEDAAGVPLSTPEERRRHLGRLYFRLGESVDMWKTGKSSHPEKPKTTTYTRNNIKREGKTRKQQKALVRGGGWLPAAAIGKEQPAGTQVRPG